MCSVCGNNMSLSRKHVREVWKVGVEYRLENRKENAIRMVPQMWAIRIVIFVRANG